MSKKEKGGKGNVLTEAFEYVKPKGRKGIPAPPTIAIGTESGAPGTTVSSGLSSAGLQIAQLQASYQQQATLIAAATGTSKPGGNPITAAANDANATAGTGPAPAKPATGPSAAALQIQQLQETLQQQGAATTGNTNSADNSAKGTASSTLSGSGTGGPPGRRQKSKAQPAIYTSPTAAGNSNIANAAGQGTGTTGTAAPPAQAPGNPTTEAAHGATPTADTSPAPATPATGLSAAALQIQQLQQTLQQQDAIITANTQAITGNTSSLENSAKGAASSILGGSGISGLLGGGGLIGDLLSGISSLFGGGPKTPAPLPIYTPPPPVAISATIAGGNAGVTGAVGAIPAAAATTTQNFTLQISALDASSIMDRSADIATAVRSALLDMHPLGQTIQNL